MALQPLFIRGWKQLSAYKRFLLLYAKIQQKVENQ